MINFKLSAEEISELSQQIANFEVILKALDDHPKIALSIDQSANLDDWQELANTAN